MWKWIAGIVAVPIGLGGIVYAIGLTLPRDHVARAELAVGAPPGDVARIVRDVEAQPSWRSGVRGIEVVRRTGGVLSYVEHSGDGDIAFDFVEETPGAVFRSTITDPNLPFGGSWTIALAPEGEGTRISIEERGEVRNPVFRFFARFVFGHERTMRTYLADLGRALKRAGG
ncbi:SRPBCC family protein [Allosphingosinicella sp.]|uniref:SRPBCC family protein n=1 Tax=Allosphingosinicella sp. TaxID=2823234 RepID=UPI002EEF1F2F